MNNPLFIGIDGGGTTTKVVARSSPQAPPLELVGAGTNPNRVGFVQAAQTLVELIQQVRAELNAPSIGRICAGISGCGREADQQQLADLVQENLRQDTISLRVTHDGIIAHEGAFAGRSGVLLMIGTGSLVMARTPEAMFRRAGGWGYLLGDPGSGYALGLRAVQTLMEAWDLGQHAPFLYTLMHTHNFHHRNLVITKVYRENFPLQTLAPLIIAQAENGDLLAQEIIETEVDILVHQTKQFVEQHPDLTPHLAYIGRLTQEPFYRNALLAALAWHLPKWHIQSPQASPAMGALRMAESGLDQ